MSDSDTFKSVINSPTTSPDSSPVNNCNSNSSRTFVDKKNYNKTNYSEKSNDLKKQKENLSESGHEHLTENNREDHTNLSSNLTLTLNATYTVNKSSKSYLQDQSVKVTSHYEDCMNVDTSENRTDRETLPLSSAVAVLPHDSDSAQTSKSQTGTGSRQSPVIYWYMPGKGKLKQVQGASQLESSSRHDSGATLREMSLLSARRENPEICFENVLLAEDMSIISNKSVQPSSIHSDQGPWKNGSLNQDLHDRTNSHPEIGVNEEEDVLNRNSHSSENKDRDQKHQSDHDDRNLFERDQEQSECYLDTLRNSKLLDVDYNENVRNINYSRVNSVEKHGNSNGQIKTNVSHDSSKPIPKARTIFRINYKTRNINSDEPNLNPRSSAQTSLYKTRHNTGEILRERLSENWKENSYNSNENVTFDISETHMQNIGANINDRVSEDKLTRGTYVEVSSDSIPRTSSCSGEKTFSLPRNHLEINEDLDKEPSDKYSVEDPLRELTNGSVTFDNATYSIEETCSLPHKRHKKCDNHNIKRSFNKHKDMKQPREMRRFTGRLSISDKTSDSLDTMSTFHLNPTGAISELNPDNREEFDNPNKKYYPTSTAPNISVQALSPNTKATRHSHRHKTYDKTVRFHGIGKTGHEVTSQQPLIHHISARMKTPQLDAKYQRRSNKSGVLKRNTLSMETTDKVGNLYNGGPQKGKSSLRHDKETSFGNLDPIQVENTSNSSTCDPGDFLQSYYQEEDYDSSGEGISCFQMEKVQTMHKRQLRKSPCRSCKDVSSDTSVKSGCESPVKSSPKSVNRDCMDVNKCWPLPEESPCDSDVSDSSNCVKYSAKSRDCSCDDRSKYRQVPVMMSQRVQTECCPEPIKIRNCCSGSKRDVTSLRSQCSRRGCGDNMEEFDYKTGESRQRLYNRCQQLIDKLQTNAAKISKHRLSQDTHSPRSDSRISSRRGSMSPLQGNRSKKDNRVSRDIGKTFSATRKESTKKVSKKRSKPRTPVSSTSPSETEESETSEEDDDGETSDCSSEASSSSNHESSTCQESSSISDDPKPSKSRKSKQDEKQKRRKSLPDCPNDSKTCEQEEQNQDCPKPCPKTSNEQTDCYQSKPACPGMSKPNNQCFDETKNYPYQNSNYYEESQAPTTATSSTKCCCFWPIVLFTALSIGSIAMFMLFPYIKGGFQVQFVPNRCKVSSTGERSCNLGQNDASQQFNRYRMQEVEEPRRQNHKVAGFRNPVYSDAPYGQEEEQQRRQRHKFTGFKRPVYVETPYAQEYEEPRRQRQKFAGPVYVEAPYAQDYEEPRRQRQKSAGFKTPVYVEKPYVQEDREQRHERQQDAPYVETPNNYVNTDDNSGNSPPEENVETQRSDPPEEKVQVESKEGKLPESESSPANEQGDGLICRPFTTMFTKKCGSYQP